MSEETEKVATGFDGMIYLLAVHVRMWEENPDKETGDHLHVFMRSMIEHNSTGQIIYLTTFLAIALGADPMLEALVELRSQREAAARRN